MARGGSRCRLRARDLIDAVIHHDHAEIPRLERRDRRQATQLHQKRAVAFERKDTPVGLRQRNPERDWKREAHAAQHVEVLRPMTGSPEIEIGIADAADDGFFILQPGDETGGKIGAVHHLVFTRGRIGGLTHGIAHLSNTLPPVNSGDKISATGACVVIACLIDRSTMNSNSSSRVAVWCSMASASSTGRMVRHTSDWP